MSQNPCARPLTSPATWLGFSSDPSEERRRGDGCYGKGWTFRCSTLTCNKCNNYGFLNTHTCIFIHIYIFIYWLIDFIYLFIWYMHTEVRSSQKVLKLKCSVLGSGLWTSRSGHGGRKGESLTAVFSQLVDLHIRIHWVKCGTSLSDILQLAPESRNTCPWYSWCMAGF